MGKALTTAAAAAGLTKSVVPQHLMLLVVELAVTWPGG
jgi:hypothetical protein